MDNEDAQKYLEHIRSLLRDKKPPELQAPLAENPLLAEINDDLKAIRETMFAFSTGDFSQSIAARGFIAGCLKNLQANLRHMIWQVQMVEKGDFSQEVHFLGEFSTAFNNMVAKLRQSLSELREKEICLKESEAHFKFLANHDHLTGAYNRRPFIELTEMKLSNAAAIPCCLAMMDIDHFKEFNDTYGHLAGDYALRHAVKTVGSSLRGEDFIGRYGGEEFTIFLYNASEEVGLKVIERLRKNLSGKPILLDIGLIPIYASFGVAGSGSEDPKDKDYIQKLINNADAALYAAKNAGRNRTMLYKGRDHNNNPVVEEAAG
nr:Diguanylate cyclase [uncultured bacterium]